MNNTKRIWQYFKKHKILIAIAFVSSMAVSGTDAAIAYMVKDILDGIFISKDEKMLRLVPLMIISLFTFRCGARFLQSYSIQYAGQKAVQSIRDDMYQKIIHQPMSYFSENSIGIMMTKIINDVSNLQRAISSAMRIFRSSLSIVFLTGIVFFQNPKLGISVFILAPILFLIVHKSGKKIKKTSHKIQEYTGEMGSALNESFSGIRVVKSFAAEIREYSKFKKVALSELKYKLRQAMITSVSSPMIETLSGFSIAAIILYGGTMVISGETTTGTFFSFVTAFGMMFEPIKKLNNYNQIIQVARASMERIFSVLDTENSILDNNGALQCNANEKNITFKNVSFRYKPDSAKVLDNISLSVPFGTSVALVGSSGAGKSSLVSLLPRFYDVTEGAIQIGGTDLRDFDVYSLRRNISIVSQSAFLFNNTVRYNIAYGFDKIEESRIIEAAEQAYATDFINDLPEGLDSLLGERGCKLSGGQKQRLTIARAILMNSPVLILDEATSALDTESEKIVQKALTNLMKNKTSFTIAHRLSTIINADIIAVMDNGKIIDTGTHTELLEKSDIYSKLFEMQFKNSR
ncbi:ABC transporter related protein [Denitrovibrio acetiphilus DSM 12809]|uniref:ABC transporter related protein n=1 Tax=Denitrovibrio acetiphilus (strain DSM 12809 / NBRC 114555 / N2460) TaxID=522772 RepID=D4H358_DENA2|nr:ABC transporter related protein [Denitrovibrio acetiphilus DSM 12809]